VDPSLDNTPDHPNRTIAAEKHMLTVFWNLDGFQVVTIHPTGASFNAAWFRDGNLLSLQNLFFGGRRSDQNKSMFHINNDPKLFHT
jgi:hypothetical protein